MPPGRQPGQLVIDHAEQVGTRPGCNQEPPEWWWAAAEAGPAPEDIPTSITSINCRHSNCHPSTAHVGKNSKVGHTAHRARCHSTSAQSGTLHAVPGPFSAASDGGRPCTMTTARPCHLIAAATSAKAESTAAAPIGSPPSETACRVTSRTLPARARAQIQDLQCRTLTRRISGGHLRLDHFSVSVCGMSVCGVLITSHQAVRLNLSSAKLRKPFKHEEKSLTCH